jgi:polyprenyl-phospho-N-acetylgalactosaminyl synthase
MIVEPNAAAPGAAAPAANAPAFRVTAVIPARNEEARIGRTLAELGRVVDEMIVIDDASTDATGEVAQRAGAVVVRNPARLGYVGSVRRGFAAATGEIVVTVDADGEMPLELLAPLVAPIRTGAADMVQGHRDHVPRISERLLSRVARLGGPVGDSGSGFRAMRRELAAGLEIPGSCICGSLALEALSKGARIAEIPIRSRPVPGRRSIAWNHARQLLTVLRLISRARSAGRGNARASGREGPA